MTVSPSLMTVAIIAIITIMAAAAGVIAADYDKATNTDTSCTKGRLWISEQLTGTVRAYSLDNGMGAGKCLHIHFPYRGCRFGFALHHSYGLLS